MLISLIANVCASLHPTFFKIIFCLILKIRVGLSSVAPFLRCGWECGHACRLPAPCISRHKRYIIIIIIFFWLRKIAIYHLGVGSLLAAIRSLNGAGAAFWCLQSSAVLHTNKQKSVAERGRGRKKKYICSTGRERPKRQLPAKRDWRGSLEHLWKLWATTAFFFFFPLPPSSLRKTVSCYLLGCI